MSGTGQSVNYSIFGTKGPKNRLLGRWGLEHGFVVCGGADPSSHLPFPF